MPPVPLGSAPEPLAVIALDQPPDKLQAFSRKMSREFSEYRGPLAGHPLGAHLCGRVRVADRDTHFKHGEHMFWLVRWWWLRLCWPPSTAGGRGGSYTVTWLELAVDFQLTVGSRIQRRHAPADSADSWLSQASMLRDMVHRMFVLCNTEFPFDAVSVRTLCALGFSDHAISGLQSRPVFVSPHTSAVLAACAHAVSDAALTAGRTQPGFRWRITALLQQLRLSPLAPESASLRPPDLATERTALHTAALKLSKQVTHARNAERKCGMHNATVVSQGRHFLSP